MTERDDPGWSSYQEAAEYVLDRLRDDSDPSARYGPGRVVVTPIEASDR
ncbi:hypothetical protein [Actinopolymorpha rutila]|uniref:Uncharacterized protein n=1 Tax=Actinopolymorpha rutila TaxID=446787 RepID=A0A852ZWI3_9ACTN|nr:hypothetical protein [Actinopolymorpha rutila]NYH93320.1 hypothetical protein [Actinopolymorpha rutila]